MRLLIAGGGTGGHIYPALAVADSLRHRPNPPELGWIGGHRGLEDRIVRGAGIPLRRLALRSLRTVDRDVHLVLDPARLALSVPQALALLAADRPSAIFTTGGYVAIPILVAAAILRIPVLLWEGNVVPGRSVRATARLASAIAVSVAATCAALGGRRPCLETGTPIRETRGIDRLAARERLEIPPGARVLLVFGGSQAVRRFNTAVAEVLPRLLERIHVIHVTGDDGYAAALAARERLPADAQARYRPEPFLRDEMLTALAAADLVLGRAGSSTLAEVTALGLPMIVVPYPHAGGHQRANAVRLADAGAARLIEDADLDGAALLEATRILDEPATHAAMAAASRSLGRPAAADAVATMLLALALREPLPDAASVERIARGGGSLAGRP
ncbi:MAG: UDP-N-acetylglucosamine--N-acetylmuramyl-(pentapeptide) pyrophosphoryl-undecaprenol N-acetylglucosamine transferase [Chloroflexota bacterium]|nr:MAG: UDP-N-acetylglucosamine--N-acetylmuramyl-(pentapeptide) pyrophosphoryl-undecaprenol N-acetylglucosamine transferase [Chloroflexota bacterium]